MSEPTSMTFCVRLGPGVAPDKIGGKARSLLRLADAGLLVPRAIVVTTSSCVMPRHRSRSKRSLSRNMFWPITSQRPDSCQISAGCSAGSSISCPPIALISSRITCSTRLVTRNPSGSSEYRPAPSWRR